MDRSTLTILALAALAPALGGCHAALIGNVFVLFVTLGIFLGTLGLGKSGLGRNASSTRSADRSASESQS